MIRPWRDRMVRAGLGPGLGHWGKPRCDGVKAECPSLMRDPQGTIERFFYLDACRANGVVNLIELARMRNGEVLPKAPGGLQAQNAGQLLIGRRWPMQIGGLGWQNSKPAVEAG